MRPYSVSACWSSRAPRAVIARGDECRSIHFLGEAWVFAEIRQLGGLWIVVTEIVVHLGRVELCSTGTFRFADRTPNTAFHNPAPSLS